ncbi:CAAX protease [Loktanella sp. S4079]|nr:CAAX protease [Loktanella sp. S4079]
MADPYVLHRNFVNVAARAPQLWRVVVVLVGFEIVFAISPDLVLGLLPSSALQDAYKEGTSAFGTLAQFLTFGLSGCGLVMLVQLLHARGFWSLIGPQQSAWRDLCAVTGVVSIVLFVLELLPPWYDLGAVDSVRPLTVWVSLIPVTLVALLIQVGTEEMLFRGYLQQQLACLSSRRWMWMGVPSLMFGMLHYWNGNGQVEGLMWALWAMLLGMACADLTARSGNLGAAIGLHLANNAFALLLYGIANWPGTGVALFLFPYEDPASFGAQINALPTFAIVMQIISQALSVFVMWLAARYAIRR